MSKCKRCGMCCQCLENWEEKDDTQRALLRMWDKGAELTFKEVKDNICPHLSYDGQITICKIYKKRHNFCKALKPNSKECKFARGEVSGKSEGKNDK